MPLRLASILTALAAWQFVKAEDHHGQGAEGSVMGPVAFMWPDDRKYVPARLSVLFRGLSRPSIPLTGSICGRC